MNGVGTNLIYRNRFKDLDPDEAIRSFQNKKTKRLRDEEFIPLPKISNDDHIPRYVILSAKKSGEKEPRPLSSYNVFQIEKGLKFISKEYSEVTELRSGDLLVKTHNKKSAEKFIKANFVDIVPITVTYHKTLNSSQGRIYSRNIINISEAELIESLKDQKVIEVRKIMKKENDALLATGAAILTFDLINRPDKINIGWERVRVNEHIPNPMRCVNCQRLGHTKNRCKNIEVCKTCANPPPHEACPRKFCVNCETDSHSSYETICPTFLKHKAVNKVKIDFRCTVREAWKVYNSDPNSFKIEPFIKKKPTSAQILKTQDQNKTEKITKSSSNEDNSAQIQHISKSQQNHTTTTTQSTSQPLPLQKTTTTSTLQNSTLQSTPKNAKQEYTMEIDLDSSDHSLSSSPLKSNSNNKTLSPLSKLIKSSSKQSLKNKPKQ